MNGKNMTWLESLLDRNKKFRDRADVDRLPVSRTPGRCALITCMDPRVNLEALGLSGFDEMGSTDSDVRVIRTIGGMAEDRSLIVGIHLAGIKEFAVVMHTDCGNCLAKQNIGKIVDGMGSTMSDGALKQFKSENGAVWPDDLVQYLKAFDDPKIAVQNEVRSIREKTFVPDDVVVHGLVYHLDSGHLELVINGYDV